MAIPASAFVVREGASSTLTGTNPISMTLLGTYEMGISGESAAEIVAYDAASQRLFVTNSSSDTIDVLSASFMSYVSKMQKATTLATKRCPKRRYWLGNGQQYLTRLLSVREMISQTG